MRRAIVLTAAALLFVLAGSSSAQTYSANLNALQEGGSVISPASGSGSFTLNGAKMLSFNISYSGLVGTETAAHIHCCAPPGTPAGVLFPLPAGNPKVGSVGPLNAQQEADLNAGLMYVNIHTTAYSGGEIRGQIYSTVPAEKDTWTIVKKLYR